MPDKDGDDEKSTKSVVNKKQKQMMGEEGYDHLRDMGRIRKNKDKKDATTMPPSKEMEKTRKVNKGPSALDIVKKKYKGQIMDMKTEEAKSLFSTPGLDKLKKLKDFKKNADRVFGRKSPDLTKVAESFGGHIISEQEFSDRQKSDMKKLLNKNFGSKEQSKETAGKLIKDKAKKDVERVQSGRNIKKTINPNVSKGSGDGIKKKKVFSGDKTGAYQATKSDIEARKGFAGSKTTDSKGNVKKISGLKDDERNQYVKRQVRKTRQDSQKGDILKGNIYDAPKVTDKDFKRGLKDVGKEGSKIRKARAQAFKDVQTEPAFSGGLEGSKPTFTKKSTFDKSTLPKTDFGKPTIPRKKKTVSIPKDTGSFKEVEKTKKKFSDMSREIGVARKELTTSKTKVDRAAAFQDVEKNIARVERGKKISKGADFSGVSRQTGKMKSGPKVVKQLGRNPKLGGSVVKVIGKETGEAAAKTAAKKALQKGAAKGLAKQIPGVGSMLAGAEAGYRALKGDFAGAALSAGEAIPGVGLGFAGANIARDVSKAKKAAGVVKNVTKAKRAKDAVKVVTPTVVGSRADKIAQAKKGISNFAKTPAGKIAVVGGGALPGKQIEKSFDPRKIKPPTVKGGRAGRRSAKS